jgi:RNA polymerase sigma-32 factor
MNRDDEMRKSGQQGNWSPDDRSPRRVESLSRHDEAELARQLRDGDQGAGDRLVTSHLPFVVKMAQRYSRYGTPLNDLVQEGVIGLIQAVQRFNPNHDTRLSTYAAWWIRAAMQEHVMRSWSLVRIGTTTTQKTLFFRLRRLAVEHSNGFYDDLSESVEESIRALARRFGFNGTDMLAFARRIAGRDRSLDQPVGETETGTWLDRVTDQRPDPEQHAVSASETDFWQGLLAQALSKLPDRERFIINRRYLGEAKASFAAIAHELELSKERVRQLEARALETLRRALAGVAVDFSWLAAD